MRTNAGTCLNQTPLCSVGDQVKLGDVLADGFLRITFCQRHDALLEMKKEEGAEAPSPLDQLRAD